MAQSLGRGSSIGSYQIDSLLGKGGMGEVWRACDTRLGRDVAIKALPTQFASDGDRLARFEREAKVLASLNHPNIGAIYGLESTADTTFLVLELVEGETLADRIKQGPLPVTEALPLALQIADAIDAAHEKDVVHRDLKPANIKVTPDGTVKVLDFGLAKALQATDQDIANSPTLSMAATAQGIILGTAAYMSPEQARGQQVDRRTDVWAFGCVLFEMLTGRPAFRGEMVSDVLASVLAREPELAELPATLSPRLKDALQRCLQKNPKRRWHAMGDLRVELERAMTEPAAAPAATAPLHAPQRAQIAIILAFVAATAVVAGGGAWFLKPSPPAEPRPLVRFEYNVPASQPYRGIGRPILAVSPDGRHFAYNTGGGVYLRSMDALESRLIPGSEPASTTPFFSPDGEWLAYWSSDGQLQKISIGGGAPVTLTPAQNPFGATWGRDGRILFAEDDGIKRVSSDGGQAETVIKADGELMHGPSLLPDGETILYSSTRVDGPTRWDQAEIVAQRPGGPKKVLLRGGSDATYVSTGHLLYVVGTTLFAIGFDLQALETRGGPVPLVTDARRATGPAANTAAANYGVTDRGTLVYMNAVSAATAPPGALGIADGAGAVRMLDVPKADYRSPRVSPDGRQLAVETIAEGGQRTIWVYDLAGTSAMRRLTQEGSNTRPVWSPDGKRIAFGSDREGAHGIYWQLADGSGLPERLTTAEKGFEHYPESFSPDGKVLSFANVRQPLGGSSWGLWTVRLEGGGKPEVFFDLPTSNEFGSAFSPDGKWVAYASNAGATPNAPATRFAIYLQPFPATGTRYEIAQSGGAWPVWTSKGAELLFRLNATEGGAPRMSTVSISTSPSPTFTNEKPLPIKGFLPVVNHREYDALPNGRGLAMVFSAALDTPSAQPPASKIYTVLNWTEELKARVPLK